mmetsp:Transcript_345/g.661  ORF Transcript_345/g.661 Transcript_345/m.661 type:complete len:413 (+) Transcript_345:1-1239(+)|eukprot:scaffold10157_cov142-Skeletonema_dohrnii-CCMP3373.AAC.32
MNSSQQSTIALASSCLPSLDPNGQPYSMVLRGEAAELRELESALSNHPHTRKQLLTELQETADGTNDKPDEFADAELEDRQLHEASRSDNIPNNACVGDDDLQLREHKKRTRDDDLDEVDGSDNEEDFEYTSSGEEQLICYIPSVQCTCSSWDMKDTPGELLITSVRVLFIAQNKKQNETNQNQFNDVAIDGRCIALHAMDSEPSTDDENESPLSHIYCQLSDSSADDENMGFPSASIGMVAPTNIAEDEHAGGDGQLDEEDNVCGGDDGTVEVYFKPVKCESKASPEDSCQALFDALTHLASLNAVDDSNENGGGLFSMLSMMAGMGGFENGEMIMADDDEDDGDDDMVIRFGGGNNLVENDDESDGAAEAERAAMLQRLDDMLVVPPELRISSDDEGGQFDDADEDDEIL